MRGNLVAAFIPKGKLDPTNHRALIYVSKQKISRAHRNARVRSGVLARRLDRLVGRCSKPRNLRRNRFCFWI